MDRGLREFRVRGVKTNIPFLENVVNHADFQAGRVTTRWLEETPALFRFAPRARPRHPAAHLSGRRDRQRQSRRWRASRAPTRMRRRAVPPHDSAAPPDGTRQLLQRARPGRTSPSGRARRSACCSPTPPSATRTSRCWPRASAPTTCWPSPTSWRTACTICSAWRCGAAPPSTWPCASCTKIPWLRLRQPARSHPQYLFPDAAARLQRRRLHRLSRQRGGASSSTKRPRRASTSSASSIR